MKITTMSGQEIDTDKMSDKEADIIEALENLKQVCARYNVSHICFAVTSPDNGIMCQTISKDDDAARVELKFLVESLHGYIQRITGGKWGVQRMEDAPE